MLNSTIETAPASAMSMADTLSTRLRLIATTCCVCKTALADAQSVELGIGPTCRKRLAKLDAEVVGDPNWDAISDALADFAAINRTDTDRLALFEMAMEQIAIARTGADQKLANLITHYIAATQSRHDSIGGLILAIDLMGRPNLAEALRKRQYDVRIEAVQNELHIFTPFSESFKTTMWKRAIGRWNRDFKCYVVAPSRKRDLHAALVESYLGMRAIGPEGEFTVEGSSGASDDIAVSAVPAVVVRTGDVGVITGGPNNGSRGRVFWQSPDKNRLGIKSCSCNRRCNHEAMWCDVLYFSPQP